MYTPVSSDLYELAVVVMEEVIPMIICLLVLQSKVHAADTLLLVKFGWNDPSPTRTTVLSSSVCASHTPSSLI